MGGMNTLLRNLTAYSYDRSPIIASISSVFSLFHNHPTTSCTAHSTFPLSPEIWRSGALCHIIHGLRLGFSDRSRQLLGFVVFFFFFFTFSRFWWFSVLELHGSSMLSSIWIYSILRVICFDLWLALLLNLFRSVFTVRVKITRLMSIYKRKFSYFVVICLDSFLCYFDVIPL